MQKNKKLLLNVQVKYQIQHLVHVKIEFVQIIKYTQEIQIVMIIRLVV